MSREARRQAAGHPLLQATGSSRCSSYSAVCLQYNISSSLQAALQGLHCVAFVVRFRGEGVDGRVIGHSMGRVLSVKV
jgi:hypothetical protein